MVVPDSLVPRGEDGQLLAQGATESATAKVPLLVTVCALWHSQAAEHSLYQGIYYGLCLLGLSVWDCVRLWPFCEIVHSGEDLGVTTV